MRRVATFTPAMDRATVARRAGWNRAVETALPWAEHRKETEAS